MTETTVFFSSGRYGETRDRIAWRPIAGRRQVGEDSIPKECFSSRHNDKTTPIVE
ncbi:hypothetical protein K8353_06010 [Burkholderia contaminans]|nr:hypothetical protein [Burkholderia contaminans]